VKAVVALLAVLASLSCTTTSYVAQAGLGQLDLMHRARPIDDVLRDPATDERTRTLLVEVAPILDFARARGLDSKGNYRKFVALPRAASVWFVAAAKPLSLEPKSWSFPIVGSFTYLGWFDFVAAMRFRDRLKREGWDVMLRGARAFSTGGWFRDPVVSSMLSRRDDAVSSLANVLFHELVHANVLVNDQSTFNESVASFVGDALAEEYIAWHFGQDSAELAQFREELAEDREVGARFTAAYAELDELYESSASDADKLAKKRQVMARLEQELDLLHRPNNATLHGFRTYNAGFPELAQLLDHCGRDWLAFLKVLRGIGEKEFPEEQADAIGPVIATRLRAPCVR